MARSLRNRFVDAPDSYGERLRLARWERFRSCFPGIAGLRVVDLGGTADMWLRAPVRPKHVHVINLEEPPADLPDRVTGEKADVTDPAVADALSGHDLVFSNSTIEHVGGYGQRRRFAAAVEKLAPLHWVQTPYRYFPIEPHFLGPGFQFLPLNVRARAVRRWPLTHSRAGNLQEAMDAVIGIELLGRTEMRHLFPDSELIAERVLGVTKSLIAVRPERDPGARAAARG